MAVPFQFRRLNTTDLAAYTPLDGELIWNLDDFQAVMGDGSIAGGFLIGGRPHVSVTGATYSVTSANQGHTLIVNRSSAVAISMPQAALANNFSDGRQLWVYNLGTGTATLTPTTSTINGNASLALTTGQGAIIVSDGGNYFAFICRPIDTYVYSQPVAAATVTMAANERRAILDPAGTLATLTITLPPNPVDGQLAGASTTQIITALTINGAGGASTAALPTTLAAGASFTALYRAANTTWYPS